MGSGEPTTEAYWYEARGATHVPVPERFMNESALAFFRWKLLDDARACEHFKAMTESGDWKLLRAQAERGCAP